MRVNRFNGQAGNYGFTLVEILVALMIMSFVAVLSYGAFDNLLSIEQRGKDLFLQQSRIYLAQSVMLNDFFHLRARPVRDPLGGQLEAYRAPDNDYAVTFTRGGLPNFQNMPGGIQRVAYGVKDGRLIRTIWEVADQTPVTKKIDYTLAEGLRALKIEQLDYQGNFSKVWPPLNQRTRIQALPLAVRATLVLKDGETLELLVPTPNSSMVSSSTGNSGANED